MRTQQGLCMEASAIATLRMIRKHIRYLESERQRALRKGDHARAQALEREVDSWIETAMQIHVPRYR